MSAAHDAALELREAIAQLRRTPMALSGLIPILTQALDAMATQAHDIAKLRAFANDILEDWPEGGNLDGCELQDLGVKHGLLAPTMVTEPCGEHCNCAEWNDFPMECYRKTALLTNETTRDDVQTATP